MAGRANSLNKNLTYTNGYNVSSLGFNLTNSLLGSGASANQAYFLVSRTSSNGCIWSRVQLNGSITFPNFALLYNNTLITGTAAAMSGFYTGSSSGIAYPIFISAAGAAQSYTTANAGGVLTASATTSGFMTTPTITAPGTTAGFTAVSMTQQASGLQFGTFTYRINTGTAANYYLVPTSGGSSGSPSNIALPTTSAVGDYFTIAGAGNQTSFGFQRLTQAAGQYVKVGALQTTVGTGGSITTSLGGVLSLDLICIEANLGWAAIGAPSSSLVIV